MFSHFFLDRCAFDPQLLGQLYATSAFQRDFGYNYKGSYIVSAAWQTGLSMGSPIGQVVGAFVSSTSWRITYGVG